MIETMEKITPEVGDIVLAQWGYEANYPEFYKIIKISGEYATLQELKGVYMGEGSTYDSRSISTNGEPTEEKPFRRKIKKWQSGYSIRINSYKYASQWNGKPADQYNHH